MVPGFAKLALMTNITRPTLLLDTNKMINNLDRMLTRASRLNVELVPHFKTHQSKEIGEMVKAKGVERCTVSSVKMAQYFDQCGWKDITVAFPFNRLEIAAINEMVLAGVTLTLLVTDVDTVRVINKQLKGNVNLMIELDAGYGRSGISTEDGEAIKEVAETIERLEKVNFYGLYCHPGNTYHTNAIEEIRQIWSAAIKKVNFVRHNLQSINGNLKVRMGDTPGCSVVEDMNGVDEIGPGNFIFFDLVMNYLDVCDESDIAVCVACPVVAKNAKTNQVIVHGGGVHFSKDHLFDEQEQKFFGELVVLEDDGWSTIIPDAKLVSLSQEHGVLKVSNEVFEEIEVGDVLGFLPIHSCLTANLMKAYQTLDGQVFEHMEKVF